MSYKTCFNKKLVPKARNWVFIAAKSLSIILKKTINFNYLYLFIVFLPSTVYTQTFQTSDSISATDPKTEIKNKIIEAITVATEVAADVQLRIVVFPFDPRITVPQCPTGFNIKLPSQRPIQQSNRILVQCPKTAQNKLWQLYVNTRVDKMYPAMVTTRNINMGEKIDATNVKRLYIAERLLRGKHYNNLDEIHGVRLKKRLSKGQQVIEQTVCYVCKGDMVSIEALSHHFSLKTLGKALNDGNIGEVIRIQNNHSRKIIYATVREVGKVSIKI